MVLNRSPEGGITVIVPVVRLHHAALFVTDLDRAVTFWTSAFDMEVTAHKPATDAAFLRLRHSGNDHDLELVGGAERPPGETGRRRVGLHHLVWQVNTLDDLARVQAALIRHHAYTGEVEQRASWSVYGTDPDDNEFEVMWTALRGDEVSTLAARAHIGE